VVIKIVINKFEDSKTNVERWWKEFAE